MDRWQTQAVACSGGLDTSQDLLTQGTSDTGSAVILQNFEPSISAGYTRILGYNKYDSTTVTGNATSPILGVKAVFGGVLAARKNVATTGVDLYFSTGSGWTKKNAVPRSASITRYRFLYESIIAPAVIGTDGYGYAWKWDGTTETIINGAGAPANPKYAEVFINSLALAGYSANPSAVSISAPNTDTDFDGGHAAVELKVGDVIIGLKTFRQELYIFCKRSIYKITGTTSANFAVVPITNTIGCLSNDTIQEVGGDLIFLSPDGLRSIAGTNKIGDVDLGLLSGKISSILRPYCTGFSEDSYSTCQVPSKSQYRLFAYQSAAAEADSVGFLGRLVDVSYQGSPTENNLKKAYQWATMAGIKPYCADSAYDNNVEIVVFGHPTSGYVFRMERGNDFNGSNIYAIYRSPAMTFTDPTIRKVMQKVDVFMEQTGSLSANLNLILNLGDSTVLQPPIIPILQTGSYAVYDVAVYDVDTYTGVAFPVFKTDLVGSGVLIAFQFSSNNSTASYSIDSFSIQYAPKARR